MGSDSRSSRQGEAETKTVPPARESNPLPTASTIGAHASGSGGRVVRHATGNRSTVVRVHVGAEVFREDKIVIQMSARAKQVKPLGNLTCIEMGSREYVLVILD